MHRFLFTSFLLFPLLLQAQNMLWSTPQKITSRTYYTNIVGQNQSGLYYFQTSKNDRNRNILITALRHDMKLKARDEFLSSSRESLEKIVLFDNWISIIYSVRDKKADKVSLYAKMLDPDLKVIGEDKLLHTRNTNDVRTDFFDVITSRDRKEAVILIASSNDSLHNHLQMLLLDNNCNIKKKTRLNIDLDEDFELKRELLVDGVFFAMISFNRKEGLFKRQKLKILLEKRLDSTNKQVMHPLHGEQFLTNKGTLHYDNSTQSLNFTSFYYPEDTTQPEGFYQYHISTLKDSAHERKLAFSPLYMNEVFGRSRSAKDLKSLYFMRSVKRSDGGDIFICERKEIDEQQLDDVSIYGVQSSYTRYYYYFYEISVLSVNPDGTVDWHKIIKKEQISLNDEGYYSSFGVQVLNNRLYFVYNDLSRKTSNIMLYEVKPSGQSEGDIFIKGNDLDGYAIPKESIQVSSRELLIPVIKLREGFTILKLQY